MGGSLCGATNSFGKEQTLGSHLPQRAQGKSSKTGRLWSGLGITKFRRDQNPPVSSMPFLGVPGSLNASRASPVGHSPLRMRSICNASRLGLPTLPSVAPLDKEDYQEAHTFSSTASWVIPGRVLQGRYPYIEPSRCIDRSLGEAQIRELLDAGVTTFICLQAELPPQNELPLGGIRGFYPYKPIATMIASSLGSPATPEMTGGIRNDHLNKFLPPRRENNGSDTETKKAPRQLEFLHSPIVDLDIPSFDQVQTLLDVIVERLSQGAIIYLHCWGGRGRAGTIAACLLARVYGVSSEEALRRVQWSFDTRGDDKSYSPETMQQRQFVRDYVSGCLKRQ